MENTARLELFCRLFLGLFVGFFCVTAALFVRYKTVTHPQQVTAVQSEGASKAPSRTPSRTPSASALARPFVPASRSQRATPSLQPEERILITSSTSTFVTFIAAAVANFMSWRARKRRRQTNRSGAPPTSRSV